MRCPGDPDSIKVALYEFASLDFRFIERPSKIPAVGPNSNHASKVQEMRKCLGEYVQHVESNNDTSSVSWTVIINFPTFKTCFQTTSVAMAWALLALAQNQEIQTRVRDEVRQNVPADCKHITVEQLDQMEYLGCVIKETLRYMN